MDDEFGLDEGTSAREVVSPGAAVAFVDLEVCRCRDRLETDLLEKIHGSGEMAG